MILINLNFLLIIITLKVFIDYSAQKKKKKKEEEEEKRSVYRSLHTIH